jgi:TP901 family phage tail tape measure protein
MNVGDLMVSVGLDLAKLKTAFGDMMAQAKTVGAEMKTAIQDSLNVQNFKIKVTPEVEPAKGSASMGKSSGGGGEGEGWTSMGGSNNLMYAGMTAGAAALPLDMGIKAAISTYTQFDQAIANVNSMMDLTPAKVDALKQQVLELSKTVPGGPVALTNALYGIVGAGIPAGDAMTFLKTAAQTATAGATDTTTATSALIAVMNSYGLKAKDIGSISDTMFAANAAGAMTFNDFASSVGTVAGPAAQAGVSFKEVAGATAALTNEGLSAQRSTMGLRALLMGIMAPTAGASKEAKKLGLEWDANTLKSKGMTGMLQEAMTATGGNAQELKKLIPNIAAWTVAVDLGGKGAGAYKTAMDTMANSAGATGRALQAQEAGAGQQLEMMKSAIQTAQIAFVQGFAPAIAQVAGIVGKLGYAVGGVGCGPDQRRLANARTDREDRQRRRKSGWPDRQSVQRIRRRICKAGRSAYGESDASCMGTHRDSGHCAGLPGYYALVADQRVPVEDLERHKRHRRERVEWHHVVSNERLEWRRQHSDKRLEWHSCLLRAMGAVDACGARWSDRLASETDY